ncbi:serine hydrolase domain-containing protein [Amycolatopsis anabasis]|uniref:serine hydrolase domain-containing protein n=1 Tax=Amycolatopsis anabasis TaxID=1840409 RepID=UPI00131E90B2|nr:serine hydrolase domain-containing protein [Amycolatopsis anabasis]
MHQHSRRYSVSRRGALRMGLAGAGAVALTAGIAAPAARADRRPDGSRDERLDSALAGLVGDRDDPAVRSVAAIATVAGADVCWRGAAGYADRERPSRARPGVDYPYRIGSVTKAFTATVVLQLVAEGRLRLEDPIRQHLPGVVPGDDRLTVRHLLGMTSGLADFAALLFPTLRPGNSSYREFLRAMGAPIAPRDLIALAVRSGPRFEPGQRFDYSTTNYLVLGLLLERVTGRAYAGELRRRLLVPLRLRGTELPGGPRLGPRGLRGYAHFNDREDEWVDVSDRCEQGWAGGGIVSTLSDLSRFFSALLGGRLLPAELLAAMKTSSGAPPLVPGGPDPRDYGLGLQRFAHPRGDVLWGHGGYTHGYRNTVLSTSDGLDRIALCYTGFPTRPEGPPDPAAAFLQTAVEVIRPGG